MTTTQLPPPASDRLSASDEIMLRIERDPVLRSPVLAVALLDRDPVWADVVAAFERACAAFPRFRQRVREGAVPAVRSRWVEDEPFDVLDHLVHVRAPHPATLRTVLDLCTRTVVSPFDPSRSPWEATLVEGLEGGRAALALRFHHTMTDGVGAVELAHVLFDLDAEEAAPEAGPPPGRAGAGVAATVLDLATHPLATAKRAGRMTTSLASMLRPAPGPASPLYLARGLSRHLEVLEVPMAGLRSAATAAGTSINDVFLAAIGGAVRDHHERLGASLDSLWVTMPVSLRHEGDPPGGNRFTPVRFLLPVDDPDPVARARVAHGLSARWRHEPAVAWSEAVAEVLDRLPTPVLTKTFGSMLEQIDVDAVDVPGLTRPAHLAGAEVTRLWAFAPPTGAALSVTLLSHLDTACVALLVDTAAVPDPAALVTCFADAFDAVLAATPGEELPR